MTTGNPPYTLSIEVDKTGDLKELLIASSDGKTNSTYKYSRVGADKYTEIRQDVDLQTGKGTQISTKTPGGEMATFSRDVVLKEIEKKIADKNNINSIIVIDPRFEPNLDGSITPDVFDNSKKDLKAVQEIVDTIRKAPLTASLFKDILEKGNSDVAKEEPKIGQLKAPSFNADFKKSNITEIV